MWFSYDGLSFETHQSEEAAKKAADHAMQEWRDDASDGGWDEQASHVCCGKLTYDVRVESREAKEDDWGLPPGCEVVEQHFLEPVDLGTEMLSAVFDNASLTRVPHLLAEAIRIASRRECFNGSKGQLAFMTRIVGEGGLSYATGAEVDCEQLEDLLSGNSVDICGRSVCLSTEALNRSGEIGAQVYRDGIEEHIRGKYGNDGV